MSKPDSERGGLGEVVLFAFMGEAGWLAVPFAGLNALRPDQLLAGAPVVAVAVLVAITILIAILIRTGSPSFRAFDAGTKAILAMLGLIKLGLGDVTSWAGHTIVMAFSVLFAGCVVVQAPIGARAFKAK